MIREVTGDILLSQAHAIAHGHHFDSGLSLAPARALAGHGQRLPALLPHHPSQGGHGLAVVRRRRQARRQSADPMVLGGLSSDKVYPLIWEDLGGLPIPVYVYTLYRSNQAAVEG